MVPFFFLLLHFFANMSQGFFVNTNFTLFRIKIEVVSKMTVFKNKALFSLGSSKSVLQVPLVNYLSFQNA